MNTSTSESRKIETLQAANLQTSEVLTCLGASCPHTRMMSMPLGQGESQSCQVTHEAKEAQIQVRSAGIPVTSLDQHRQFEETAFKEKAQSHANTIPPVCPRRSQFGL